MRSKNTINQRHQVIAIAVEIAPSFKLRRWMVVVHLLGSLLVLGLDLRVGYKFLLLMLVAAALIYAVNIWRKLSGIQGFFVREGQMFLKIESSSEWVEAQLYNHQIISEKFCLLCFCINGDTLLRLPLLDDSASCDALRKLRQFLLSSVAQNYYFQTETLAKKLRLP